MEQINPDLLAPHETSRPFFKLQASALGGGFERVRYIGAAFVFPYVTQSCHLDSASTYASVVHFYHSPFVT